MALTQCNYCDHGNPADAKYCNACGATLTLAPCPHCGAVNEVTSTHCYQCRGSLQESGKDLVVSEAPVAMDSRRSLRRYAPAIVGTVVVAIVAFIGYRHDAPDGVSPTSAANTEAKGRSGRVEPVSPPVPAATPAVPVAPTPASAVLPAETAPPPSIPPAIPQTTERSASRQPVESPAGGAGAAPVARPRTIDAGKAGALETARLGPCTERVAALGLCTLKPGARLEAEAAAAGPAAAARPQAKNDGEPCSEAVAALGLCTLKSK